MGNTVRVMRDPKALPIWAAQSLKKSGCLNSEAGLDAFDTMQYLKFPWRELSRATWQTLVQAIWLSAKQLVLL